MRTRLDCHQGLLGQDDRERPKLGQKFAGTDGWARDPAGTNGCKTAEYTRRALLILACRPAEPNNGEVCSKIRKQEGLV